MMGYRSTSLLTIPLKHGPATVIGVIRLLDADDPTSGAIVPFDDELHPIVQALASLAAIAALAAYQREQGLRQGFQELRVEIYRVPRPVKLPRSPRPTTFATSANERAHFENGQPL